MPAHHQNTLGDRNTPWQDFMKDLISSFWSRNSCSCNLLWLARKSVSACISFSLADWMVVKHSSVISTFKTVASARVTARQNAKTAISMLSVAAFIAITISVPSLRAFSTFWMLSCKSLIVCLRSWSSLSRLAFCSLTSSYLSISSTRLLYLDITNCILRCVPLYFLICLHSQLACWAQRRALSHSSSSSSLPQFDDVEPPPPQDSETVVAAST